MDGFLLVSCFLKDRKYILCFSFGTFGGID
uniref:Uncharacterized protein n=1 Tax=Rhizophora mucronata TaxID=61149 RepID=A0A2P2P6F6_RHIMU